MQRPFRSHRIPLSRSCVSAEGRLNLYETWKRGIPQEMRVFLHVVCREGNGGNGVYGKGEVWVVGSVLNTV